MRVFQEHEMFITGFIGSVLVEYVANISNFAVVGMVRSIKDISINTTDEFRLGEIGSPNEWGNNLSDIVVRGIKL